MAYARKVGSTFLDGFDTIICDEAHHVPDIARQSLGFRVGARSVAIASQFAAPVTGTEIRRVSESLFTELGEMNAANTAASVPTTRIKEAGVVAADRLISLLNRAAEETQRSLADVIEDPEAAADRRNRLTALAEIITNLEQADTLGDPGTVYFVEGRGGSANLCAAIVKPGKELNTKIWSRVRSVVACSATMKPFSWMRSELGIAATATETDVPSPFDTRGRRILYAPTDLPVPGNPEFRARVASRIVDISDAVGGRILCLFTSYAGLREAASIIRARRPGLAIGVQGEAPRDRLVAEFESRDDALLLGVDSFWTGFDSPGMRGVVIDKLPFPSGDPVLETLKERESDSFQRYFIPRAIQKWIQGIGRLMRRSEDRGVIAILDKRIWTKNYGSRFLKVADIVAFSKNLGGKPESRGVVDWIEGIDAEKK